MRRRPGRRALAARVALLEAENGRLRDHLAVALALSGDLLKEKIHEEMAAGLAESIRRNSFRQYATSLAVYGVRTTPPPTFPGGI